MRRDFRAGHVAALPTQLLSNDTWLPRSAHPLSAGLSVHGSWSKGMRDAVRIQVDERTTEQAGGGWKRGKTELSFREQKHVSIFEAWM